MKKRVVSRQTLIKQIAGIEPVSPAWEASVLPMNYICMAIIIAWSVPFVKKKMTIEYCSLLTSTDSAPAESVPSWPGRASEDSSK